MGNIFGDYISFGNMSSITQYRTRSDVKGSSSSGSVPPIRDNVETFNFNAKTETYDTKNEKTVNDDDYTKFDVPLSDDNIEYILNDMGKDISKNKKEYTSEELSFLNPNMEEIDLSKYDYGSSEYEQYVSDKEELLQQQIDFYNGLLEPYDEVTQEYVKYLEEVYGYSFSGSTSADLNSAINSFDWKAEYLNAQAIAPVEKIIRALVDNGIDPCEFLGLTKEELCSKTRAELSTLINDAMNRHLSEIQQLEGAVSELEKEKSELWWTSITKCRDFKEYDPDKIPDDINMDDLGSEEEIAKIKKYLEDGVITYEQVKKMYEGYPSVPGVIGDYSNGYSSKAEQLKDISSCDSFPEFKDIYKLYRFLAIKKGFGFANKEFLDKGIQDDVNRYKGYLDYKEYYDSLKKYKFSDDGIKSVESILNDLIDEYRDKGLYKEIGANKFKYNDVIKALKENKAKFGSSEKAGVNNFITFLESYVTNDSEYNYISYNDLVKAAKSYEWVTQKDLMNWVDTAFEGETSGVQTWAQGIMGWTGATEHSALDYKNMYIAQMFETACGDALKINYDLNSSIGNMLPSIGLSFVNPTLGQISFFLSAGGNSFRTAQLDYGASDLQAFAYGVLSGLSEVTLEKFLGGIPGLSDVNVTSFKTWVQAAVKEGNEEFTQDIIDKMALSGLQIDKDAYKSLGDPNEVSTWLYDWVLGALSAGALNSVSLGVSARADWINSNNIGTSIFSDGVDPISSGLGPVATGDGTSVFSSYVSEVNGNSVFSNTETDFKNGMSKLNTDKNTTNNQTSTNSEYFNGSFDDEINKVEVNLRNIKNKINNNEKLTSFEKLYYLACNFNDSTKKQIYNELNVSFAEREEMELIMDVSKIFKSHFAYSTLSGIYNIRNALINDQLGLYFKEGSYTYNEFAMMGYQKVLDYFNLKDSDIKKVYTEENQEIKQSFIATAFAFEAFDNALLDAKLNNDEFRYNLILKYKEVLYYRKGFKLGLINKKTAYFNSWYNGIVISDDYISNLNYTTIFHEMGHKIFNDYFHNASDLFKYNDMLSGLKYDKNSGEVSIDNSNPNYWATRDLQSQLSKLAEKVNDVLRQAWEYAKMEMNDYISELRNKAHDDIRKNRDLIINRINEEKGEGKKSTTRIENFINKNFLRYKIDNELFEKYYKILYDEKFNNILNRIVENCEYGISPLPLIATIIDEMSFANYTVWTSHGAEYYKEKNESDSKYHKYCLSVNEQFAEISELILSGHADYLSYLQDIFGLEYTDNFLSFFRKFIKYDFDQILYR